VTSATAPVPAAAPPARHHAPVGRIILVVVGAILVLIGLGIGGGGGFLTWAYATQRDADGYFTTGDGRLETVGYAVTSEDIDLGAGWDVDLGDLATVRLDVDSASDQAVFVGIGPRLDVDRYLRGVAHAEVDDVEIDPFEVTYRFTEGGRSPEPPGRADFWVATAEGRGPQSLEWDLESGRWSVVLMNADGSAGVAATVAAGVTADWVLPAAIGLLVFGGVLLLGGAVMLAVGAVGLAHHQGGPGAVTGVPVGELAWTAVSPVRLEGRLEPLSRWLWLVKWILVIPHLVVLFLLWVAFAVLSVVAWFAILFTGRYPQGIFDFNVGVLRWSWRVGYYSFSAFGTDRYPPFSLRPDPDQPATLEIARPEKLSRGLVLVKSWLLAIPHLLVVGVFLGGGGWDSYGGVARWPGLLPLLLVVAVVVLLFTGRYPGGLFDLVMGLNRWVYRVIAYVALMTDEYPPFRLDQGGTEPFTGAPTTSIGSLPGHDAAASA